MHDLKSRGSGGAFGLSRLMMDVTQADKDVKTARPHSSQRPDGR
jgi:hypothetical protein